MIPGAGAGLIGLTERVQLAGGRSSTASAAGEFRLWAWLPWTAEPRSACSSSTTTRWCAPG